MGKWNKLPVSFYRRADVTVVAKDLLGKYLFTNIDGELSGGRIVEVEAYCGATDRACHAYQNKKTKRTSVMFEAGGLAYVYLIYGIHKLFNIVTNQEGVADAVLVRAIEPYQGVDIIESRRRLPVSNTTISSGPGNVSKALGIGMNHYGQSLAASQVWLEDRSDNIGNIGVAKRVGVDYAGADADLLWRYYVRDNPYVSKIPR